jgi:hypothetical protein
MTIVLRNGVPLQGGWLFAMFLYDRVALSLPREVL